MDPAAPSQLDLSHGASSVTQWGHHSHLPPGMKVPPPELSCLGLLCEATGIFRSQQLPGLCSIQLLSPGLSPHLSAGSSSGTSAAHLLTLQRLSLLLFSLPMIPAGFGSRFKGLLERWECVQSCDTSGQSGLGGENPGGF